MFHLHSKKQEPPPPPESDADSQTSPERKRDVLQRYLNDQFTKGKLKLDHSLGLGQTPNVIPPGEANIKSPPRPVEIGWHPVAGFAGKWFAEKTGLGKLITEKIRSYPDPTQHWAILVGDYCHELWMDENLHVIYINERVKRDEWKTFEVGSTRFNDEALRQAGEMTIYNMRQQRPAYNLISNNCQNFATRLLDAIQVGAHRQFATTFAVYQRATGAGRIMDLFPPADKLPEGEPDQEVPSNEHQNALAHAQQVMDANTTKLDSHDTKSYESEHDYEQHHHHHHAAEPSA